MGINSTEHLPGAEGDGIQVFDIEYRWNRGHEDLQRNSLEIIGNRAPVLGNINATNGGIDHGTSVAGIIKTEKGFFGVGGVASNATFRPFSQFIDIPALNLPDSKTLYRRCYRRSPLEARPGDVILLDSATDLVSSRPIANAPIERWPQDWAAIKFSTDRGIVVVEAAGNGGRSPNSRNLTDYAAFFRDPTSGGRQLAASDGPATARRIGNRLDRAKVVPLALRKAHG